MEAMCHDDIIYAEMVVMLTLNMEGYLILINYVHNYLKWQFIRHTIFSWKYNFLLFKFVHCSYHCLANPIICETR